MMIQVVILAAGAGKRMHSRLPKVLHQLAGIPLLEHVLQTVTQLQSANEPIVIYGHQGSLLKERLGHYDVRWIEQAEQLGTAHALLQALPALTKDGYVLVLYGDVPLITMDTLKKLIDATPEGDIGMLTAHLTQPAGYGRIIRDEQKRIIDIVEEKDAAVKQRTITEINTGIYFLPATFLEKCLPTIENKNVQQEYYLTDIIQLAVSEKVSIHAVQPAYAEEILGVNDPLQLSHLERFYQRQMAEKLMRQGVVLSDPARLDVRGHVTIGRDVTIDVNVVLEGRVVIGDDCVIGSNVLLRDVELGDRVKVRANTLAEGAKIASDCIIGPYARLRPDTVLAEQVHIGNFVEIKKSHVAQGSKINHLSYVGDSEVGKEVNIGAGTITCNYDGVRKHKTVIGDRAFIGSCTQLVAPVSVGEGATIGAGSTITHDAPPNKLTLARARQQTKDDWQQPVKDSLTK